MLKENEALRRWALEHPEEFKAMLSILSDKRALECFICLVLVGVMSQAAKRIATEAIESAESADRVSRAMQSHDFKELEKILIDKTK